MEVGSEPANGRAGNEAHSGALSSLLGQKQPVPERTRKSTDFQWESKPTNGRAGNEAHSGALSSLLGQKQNKKQNNPFQKEHADQRISSGSRNRPMGERETRLILVP